MNYEDMVIQCMRPNRPVTLGDIHTAAKVRKIRLGLDEDVFRVLHDLRKRGVVVSEELKRTPIFTLVQA